MQILGAGLHRQRETIGSHFILILITAEQEAVGSTVQWCSKKQAKPFNPGSKWSEAPSVRSHRWNQKVTMTTGQVTVTVVPPDVHQFLNVSNFCVTTIFVAFHCEDNQSPFNQLPHKYVFLSCGDDKTISLLFQFSKYSNTGLLLMLYPPESRVFQ